MKMFVKRHATMVGLVLLGLVSGVPTSIDRVIAGELFSLECNYTTVFYYRGQNVIEEPGITVITIDPGENRFSENGRAWEGMNGTSAGTYVLRDESDKIVEEPLDGLVKERASISRTDGSYSVRYEDNYEAGGVPVLTSERIGKCQPTELLNPS